MKPNAFRLLALLWLVVTGAAGASLARGGRHGHRPGGPEAKTYFRANVLPVLRQQRQKLEPQLTAADRTQLATYRAQLQDVKARRHAFRQSLRPASATPGTRPALTEAQQQQAHQLRTEAHGIMLNVAQLAQKYDAAITQLATEIQPQKKQWAADLQAMAAKNGTPGQQARRAAFAGRAHGPGGLRRFFKPAMFLLMDPNAPAVGSPERGLGNTSFYPNPAAATSQLEYEVKKTGPVTVDLLDQNGNKLRTLVSEAKVEKGPRTETLDLRDLPAGTYFYKITTKGGSETKRFVKE